MREHLTDLWSAARRKPWLGALIVAGVYLLVSLLLLVEGDGGGERGRNLPAQGPDALEVALTPLSAVSVFVATWAVLALMRRRPVGGVHDEEDEEPLRR